MMTKIFLLLVTYQIKHFVCDYPLQGSYMLKKFSRDVREWVPALAAHAGVQALGTMVIAALFLGFRPLVLALMLLDFASHFVMDRVKADPQLLGRFKALSAAEMTVLKQRLDSDMFWKLHGPAQGRFDQIRGNTYFWWCLGFDQMVHHLTHYLIIYIIVSQ